MSNMPKISYEDTVASMVEKEQSLMRKGIIEDEVNSIVGRDKEAILGFAKRLGFDYQEWRESESWSWEMTPREIFKHVITSRKEELRYVDVDYHRWY